MSILTDADLELLPNALRENGGFAVATDWYFNWEPLDYQTLFHHVDRLNVTFIAGIASGKTTVVAASYLMDCLTIPYFRALNTSVTAKQAVLPFEMITAWMADNPRLEHLIEDVRLRPYPIIKFKNYSEYVFRTSGRNGSLIRGEEFDRINYDEAGLDFDGYTAKVLRGRLRGVRGPQKIPRMSRFDVITSPTDAPWLRDRFDRGWPGTRNMMPQYYYSMRVSTYDNTRLTREQIALMEADYPEEMINVELRGYFPDYGMSMFPRSHINECTDQAMYDETYLALNPEDVKDPVKKGYRLEESPRFGIMLYEVPHIPGHLYLVAGDPGTDNPPKRNSAVVIVLDVTEKPYKMVYFHWVAGRGSLKPFLSSYKHAISKYHPVFKAIDATGTQKYIDELAFESEGIKVDNISFNRDKEGMLNALLMDITHHDLRFPPIKGLVQQMASYTRERDKEVPQDIVMTMAMASHMARYAPEPDRHHRRGSGKSNYRPRKQRTSGVDRRKRA